MGRIRTIKPEFPQSESIGKLSRDARLLFVQLWTIVDDAGRSRAASRMLASLLYPYDDDASGLVDNWLDELEFAGKIRRYSVGGSAYLEIVKWLEHQKIDKPSKSRLPEFVDGSRALAKPREASTADLGPRTCTSDPLSRSKDRPARVQIDLEEAIAAKAPKPAKPASRFDAFWSEYPRRDGPNPRKPAEQRFDALVKSGLDPEFGTRFIPQAITWLNQQRWSDHAAVAYLAEAAGIDLHIESAVKMFAKMRVWSKHVGPEPGQVGCKAPAELLAKYGLAPDGAKLEPVG
ncbi:hypothetical protein [Bradyrhizobium sp. AUGA SZCCT0182]|uniref:hypothetical protein n=1 Tax=Bradyrhizobium sp. AUGA SZCCT0182 TaxID=2807667 RepID=UPI001BAA1D81|nr:hypothetical protein [Bradyrhizobium sp. AUGA SZCCT0182]MBR1236860.1 hypothetical protein [Bradyrhizobium sp. AUGA SZCCT0182]